MGDAPTAKRLRRFCINEGMTQTACGWIIIFIRDPRVAERQPWAGGRNRVAVSTERVKDLTNGLTVCSYNRFQLRSYLLDEWFLARLRYSSAAAALYLKADVETPHPVSSE